MVAAAVATRPSSPLQWSPEDCVSFLTETAGLPAAAAAAFSANQIDGAALLELTQTEAKDELALVLGHRKAVFRAINELKAATKANAKAKRQPTEPSHEIIHNPLDP